MNAQARLLDFIRLKDPAGFARIRARLTPAGMASLSGDDFWDQLSDAVADYAQGAVMNEVDKRRLELLQQQAEVEQKKSTVAVGNAKRALFGGGLANLFTVRNLVIGVGIVGGLIVLARRRNSSKD